MAAHGVWWVTYQPYIKIARRMAVVNTIIHCKKGFTLLGDEGSSWSRGRSEGSEGPEERGSGLAGDSSDNYVFAFKIRNYFTGRFLALEVAN